MMTKITFRTVSLVAVLGSFAVSQTHWSSGTRVSQSAVKSRRLLVEGGSCRSLHIAQHGTWEVPAAPLPEDFAACIRRTAESPVWQELAARYLELPKLGIVVTLTKSKLDTAVLHNIETYAHTHGYGFHAAVMNVSDWSVLRDGSRLHHFYTARWHHLQQRLLGRYQWLLHIDGDMHALNMSRPLERFLQAPEDILLHIREQYEVTASAVLLRSTPFSHCFLERWIKMGTDYNRTRVNWDNGDLIELLMGLAQPPILHCKELRNGRRTYDQYIQCFREHFDQLASFHHHLPIRFFFPMSGFWRSYQGPQGNAGNAVHFQLHTRVFYTCGYPSEVLGHGWKDFQAAGPEHSRPGLPHSSGSSSIGDTLLTTCDRSLTLAEELQLATQCCFNHYPGCIDSRGVNVCAKGLHCPRNFHHWHTNCTWAFPVTEWE